MRISIPHNKKPEDIRAGIDRGFDGIFQGLPVGRVELTDEQKTWNDSRLDFSFNAHTSFLTVPVKGSILVEPALLTIDIELPGYLKSFLPEEKVAGAVESGVKVLLD